MASTFSDLLRLELQADGENDGTWGQKLNTLAQLVERAVHGTVSITSTGGTYTLSTANGTEDEARYRNIEVGGTLASNLNVVVPAKAHFFRVHNATTGSFTTTVKTASGTGIAVTQGATAQLYCDGTNVVAAVSEISGLSLVSPTINGSGGVITLPAGPDTLVGRATTDTLTNKTLTSAVLSGAGTTITVKDSNFSITGSADATKILQFEVDGLTTGTTRTLTAPDASGTLVLLNATQTLTNKTLTTPTIASIVNTGTLALPTSTDTLVGRATTDTLTNKTLTSPSIAAGALTGTFSGTHTYSGAVTVSGSINVSGTFQIGGATITATQMAKAWVYSSLTSGNVGAGFNVSSVTKTGTGTYQVNFTANISGFAAVANVVGGTGAARFAMVTGIAAGSCTIETTDSAGALCDNAFCLVVFGT